MFALEQPVRKEQATFVVFDNVLPPEACDNVVALRDQVIADVAMQGSNPHKRVSDIRWLPWSPGGGIDALYRKLADVVQIANSQFWQFHLGGFLEPLQLTHYRADNFGHYDWHADRGDNGIQTNRKISGTLLLNDDFEGGEFQLFDVEPGEVKRMRKGDLILFPSYHVHQVTPVTKGERWSLVFWVTGPPFV